MGMTADFWLPGGYLAMICLILSLFSSVNSNGVLRLFVGVSTS
jgi:hypothetical protein